MSQVGVESKTSPKQQSIEIELSAIQQTIMDLTYDGFNAVNVRANLKKTLNTEEVCTLVAAYCQVGNNVERAVGKVKKPRTDIKVLLKKSETSLARVGLAYPALVRAMRGAYKLPPRINDCKTPPDFQDPSTAPYHASGRDFHEKFSRLVFNPKKAKLNIDYFALAEANQDEASQRLMRSELPAVVAALKSGAY